MTEKIFDGGELRQWREEKGLTIERVAEMIDVAPKTIYNWEHGVYYPQPRFAAVLIKMIGGEDG